MMLSPGNAKGISQLLFHTVTFSFGGSADLSGTRLEVVTSPLDTLIVSYSKGFVKGFFTFFFDCFSQLRYLLQLASASVGGFPLPLTLIIIAGFPQIARWDNAQNTGFFRLKPCAKKLLTKTGRCGIMVNSTRLGRGRVAKKPIGKNANRAHISVRPTHKERKEGKLLVGVEGLEPSIPTLKV